MGTEKESQEENNQNGNANFTKSSSSVNIDQQLGGSNEFILVGSNEDVSFTTTMQRRFRNACSRKMIHRRLPILNWLPKYNKTWAVSDLVAGITVGLTVIPQGLAYSSVAAVPPQYGLYGSFLGCFIYILFGSCTETAFGPTAIAAMLTFEATKGQGPVYAVLLCFLTGLVQVMMGLFGLGFLIDFISGPVASGFISAGAFVIVTSQMNDMLGIEASGDSFVKTWADVIHNIKHTSAGDAIMGFTCLVVLLVMREVGKFRIRPAHKEATLNKFQNLSNTILWIVGISRNTILVVICSCISFYYCQRGEPPFRVTGYVPAGFPTIKLPDFSYTEVKNGTVHTENFWMMITDLSSGLIAVPLVGLLEDIGVCTAFANGKAIDATQEFIAIGLANMANSFVQGFPGTGALARSAVNHASGVKTTMGNLYTGLLVIISLLFLTPYFYYIPKATLAAIIIAASIFMVELKVLKPMWRAKKSDLIPGVGTFVGCLVLPFQYGILIGIGINLVSILYHAARPKISMDVLTSNEGTSYLMLKPDRCLIFPSINYVRNLVTKHSMKQGIPVVMDCTHIYGADYTAATAIKILTQDFWIRKQPLFFYNLKPSVSSVIVGLSPEEFVVYYETEEFDEMLKRWNLRKNADRTV